MTKAGPLHTELAFIKKTMKNMHPETAIYQHLEHLRLWTRRRYQMTQVPEKDLASLHFALKFGLIEEEFDRDTKRKLLLMLGPQSEWVNDHETVCPAPLKRARNRWYRDHHPDKGGSHEGIVQMNTEQDAFMIWLLKGFTENECQETEHVETFLKTAQLEQERAVLAIDQYLYYQKKDEPKDAKGAGRRWDAKGHLRDAKGHLRTSQSILFDIWTLLWCADVQDEDENLIKRVKNYMQKGERLLEKCFEFAPPVEEMRPAEVVEAEMSVECYCAILLG